MNKNRFRLASGARIAPTLTTTSSLTIHHIPARSLSLFHPRGGFLFLLRQRDGQRHRAASRRGGRRGRPGVQGGAHAHSSAAPATGFESSQRRRQDLHSM